MKRDKKYRVENLSEPDVENTVESRRDGIARWKYDASPRSSPRLSLTRQGLVRYLAFVVCKLTVERRENMKGDTNVSRWRSSHTRGKGATNEEKFFSTSISASSVLFFFLFFFFFFFSFFFLRYERVNETLLLSKLLFDQENGWFTIEKLLFHFSIHHAMRRVEKYTNHSQVKLILFFFFFYI